MCNKEKFWGKLACAVGRPEWEHDPRFETFAARLEHRDLITDLLDEVLSEHPTATWLERFAGEVPAAPVNELGPALEEGEGGGAGPCRGPSGPNRVGDDGESRSSRRRGASRPPGPRPRGRLGVGPRRDRLRLRPHRAASRRGRHLRPARPRGRDVPLEPSHGRAGDGIPRSCRSRCGPRMRVTALARGRASGRRRRAVLRVDRPILPPRDTIPGVKGRGAGPCSAENFHIIQIVENYSKVWYKVRRDRAVTHGAHRDDSVATGATYTPGPTHRARPTGYQSRIKQCNRENCPPLRRSWRLPRPRPWRRPPRTSR